jgi:anti-sigma regulatory factor (Ser/Thr protein kinase)
VHHLSTAVPSLQLRLQAQPESAQLLRQRLYLWLDEVGAQADEVFDLALACTEAFANAVEHPENPTTDLIDIDGTMCEGSITITVLDHGSWRTERQREEGGYGFPLMRRLMSRVEVQTRAEGTSIRMQRQLRQPSRLH